MSTVSHGLELRSARCLDASQVPAVCDSLAPPSNSRMIPDVAAVDDLDVGVLDQVEAEVALQEQRETAAGCGPAAVDPVAARLRNAVPSP